MKNLRTFCSSKRFKFAMVCGVLLLVASIYPHRPPQLDLTDHIQLNGRLRVAIQTDQHQVPIYSSRAGFELAIAQRFAHSLGVVMEPVPVAHAKNLYQSLREGKSDIALTHHLALPNVRSSFYFIEPYMKKELLPLINQGTEDKELSSLKLIWAYKGPKAEKFNARLAQFLTQIRSDGTFDQIYQQYFGHMEMSVAESRSFRYNLNQRLPEYQRSFEKVAQKTQLDWRLLAAIGYQESHWDSEAISPTGVRGLMMLTRATADEMGVIDRHSAKESILGGSTYFRKLKDRLDPNIPEPHRTWMALAAYNMGMGHLEDARLLTQRTNGDPNNWFDVKQHIPLLQKANYYSQVNNGYAMGARQSLLYVENVRRYFDILVGYEATPQQQDQKTLLALR